MIGVASVLVAAQPAAPAAAPAVAGEWRFDEPGGQVARDGGPNGLDGRLGATAAAGADDPVRIEGVSGHALRFDGDSFVRVPDTLHLAPPRLTVEAVVRRAGSPGAFRYIASRGGHECFAGSYGLYTGEAGGVAFYVLDGPGYVVSASARPADVWDGRWHHVAATFDGSGLRLFVDGRPVGAPSNGPKRIDYAGTTMTTAFGKYFGTCDLPYSGDLDLVRLSSGALSADAVRAAADRELRPGAQPAPPSQPAPLTPLTPAAPATRVGADRPSAPPAVAPGAPERACKLSISPTRITVGRRTRVRVRVTIRGEPAKSVVVIARRHGRAMPISRARTSRRGRARLKIRVRRPGRVRLSAAITPSCSSRYVRVTRRR